MDASERYITVCRSLGIPIIGATSVQESSYSKTADKIIHLPYITEFSFLEEFHNALWQHAISHIYSPHPGIWSHLKQLKEEQPEIYTYELCQPSPYQSDWLEIEPSYGWAREMAADDFPKNLDTVSNAILRRPLTLGEYTGLHKQFIRIAGQCDEGKLTALAHILRLTPPGDLVEIGSLFGRSAFAIAWLAGRYGIGGFISIDPWSSDLLEGQGEAATILNRDKDAIDFEQIFLGYLSNMSLLKNVGYIRATSAQGIHDYHRAVEKGCLTTPDLGEIPVTGSIALLHIDGNHHYDHVRQDIRLWEPHVIPGGWVLLDDYVWAFGDGPKKAGDQLLESGRFDLAFTMSDTLFLRKR
jgi:hypothetical protein